MIIRPTQKLAKKLKETSLAEKPLDEVALADWSASLFTADRTQYILVANTKSLYSVVMFGRGIRDANDLIIRSLNCIREAMEDDGMGDAYQNVVAPATRTVGFAKALNRTVTGSMNEFVKYAKFFLEEDLDMSPYDVGIRLNDTPMSSLGWASSRQYGTPNEAMKKVLEEREGH